jgi:protein TonB
MPVAGPTNVRPVLTVPQSAQAATTAPAVETAPAKNAASTAESAPTRNAAPAAVVEASPGADNTQADALAAYRKQLAELFARRQEYPRLAAMRGWEGEVRLRLRVARKGNLLAVVLDRSSGHDVLDRHALAMIEDMASLPALPGALAQEEIQVVVPIQYKLHKTT